ncbi:hypothetical protein [Curtobacterium sp. Leaf261]|uniref:hypothetical protein n=1 Tax=Curtobacterium sp. Leaf261 TaxID=1736311 RepID=UPI0012E117A0|nr:hypothetical protein [Curtobacterium sp. Leaf261]
MFEIIRVHTRTPPDVARSIQRAAVPHETVRTGGTVPADAFVRLTPGADVRARDWAVLHPDDRHRARIAAIAPMLEDDRAVSYASAVLLLRWPRIGELPDRVDVSERGRTRRDARGRSVVLHPLSDEDSAATRPWRVLDEPLRVTSPITTAVDVARSWSFRDAVITLDGALRQGLDREAALGSIAQGPARGSARATRAPDALIRSIARSGRAECSPRRQELRRPTAQSSSGRAERCAGLVVSVAWTR